MTFPDCWHDLANAVILRAIEDYRKSCLILKKYPHLKDAVREKRALERFFTSRWFRTLSETDGKELLNHLRKEVEFDDTGR